MTNATEQSSEPKPPVTRVFKSKFLGGGSVTAGVLWLHPQMSVNDNPYRDIISAIEDAGYYVSGPNQYVEPECTWNRIIPASKLRPQGGYTGNSFWISFDDGGWFIGVWGGRIYGIREPSNIASMAIEWMSAEPDRTFHDFETWVIAKYDLYEIDENDFRPTRLMGDRNE